MHGNIRGCIPIRGLLDRNYQAPTHTHTHTHTKYISGSTNPGLPLPGWAEIRQWAYSTQIPLYKDGDTSPSLVLTGSLGLIDRSYRDREIGVSPVGPTLAAAWG